ncbi:hypothetical protein E2320_009781, partial [Naja naja]
ILCTINPFNWQELFERQGISNYTSCFCNTECERLQSIVAGLKNAPSEQLILLFTD